MKTDFLWSVKLGTKKVHDLKITIGKKCVHCEVGSKAEERSYNININNEHNRIETCFLGNGKEGIKTE
jgi:hypothetical protein